VFSDSFVAFRKGHGTRAVALPLAITVHAAVILALIVGPLIQSVRLPRWTFTPALLVPPPPVPALPAAGRPRPAGKSVRVHPVAARAVAGDGRLIAPVRIPAEVSEEALSGSGNWSDLEGVDPEWSSGPLDAIIGRIIEDIGQEWEVSLPALAVVRPPRLVKRVAPDYPEIARQARVSGRVVVEATTDVYGRVKDVKVLESVPLLDQAALDAVRQWVFEPMVVNGRPRGVSFSVAVIFALK
jgi:protein TonB